MVNHKGSESESDGTSSADEARFRISVCMRRVHSDVRARAYVRVAPRRRVHWLRRRLRARFQLPRAFHLLCRGHLLPPRESLALLERDDLVEVVPVSAEAVKAVSDEVDSMNVVAAVEPDVSPPEVSEGLEETKRRALLMLDQFCAEPELEDAADRSTRPRRRRVRRRRRPAAGSGDELPARSPAAASRDRGRGAEAMVLRNELQPRAPRVVRPLSLPVASNNRFESASTEMFT